MNAPDPPPGTLHVEPDAMRALWRVLDHERDALDDEVRAAALRIKVFADLVAMIPPEVELAERLTSRALEARALRDGDWEPYLTRLRSEGARYAEMGVAFADWFAILGAYRRAMLARILPGVAAEARDLIAAMDDHVDIAMSTIGSAYIDAKDRIARDARADLARSVRELRRSNRELDDFAYVASHDLKAPLRDIENLAAWISEDVAGALPEGSARHLALLRDRVRRMERLLDDLLLYSRAGRISAEPEEFTLSQVVDEAVKIVAPPEGFTVRVVGVDLSVRTPRAPLAQVLRNLIGNAVKHHGGPPGVVEVAISADDERVHFEVRDDGPGIAPEYHERIFQMFQTLRSRDAVEGSGMGLAIVKKVVEAHGGAVTLRSAPGRGASFAFSWPRQWAHAGRTAG